MIRDSFIFYRSFFEATKPLSQDQKAELFDAICFYSLDQEQIQLDPICTAMFSLIKPQLDANYKRFVNGKKGADFGKLGGRPKTPKKPLDNPKLTPNVNVNVNGNVNDNVNVNVNEKKRGRFTAPSLLEVQQIFIEKGSTKLEAELFYNFYGSKNWHVGKNKMKNYKLAIAGWITRKKIEANGKPNKKARAEQLQASTNREFGVSL
tara:strand:+ start:309 stop:926 length:618 start_codon:yes stop_codon:yes gene_type:complete